jgi:DNA-binding transcriptional MerR regulator
MKDTCKKAGMTYEALKFYCNEGLVPNVKRNKNNYRIFTERDINWLIGLSYLKKCGMTLKDIKIYIDLCLKGKPSIPERKQMLDNQKKDLLIKISELNDCIDFINQKQKFYNDVLDGKIKYFSNLIDLDE